LVSFTVNLTSTDKRAWDRARAEQTWLPERPGPNAAYPGADVIRLGPFIPPGHDRWWEVGPRHASGAAAAEVLRAIELHGLPWLRSGADGGRQ
jgi:hypothetical protein